MSIQPQNTPMPPLQAHGSQRRSCDELSLCQHRKPPCAGCTCHDTSLLGHGVYHFAPGIIQGGPAKPSILRGARLVGGCALAVVAVLFGVVYLLEMLGGGL